MSGCVLLILVTGNRYGTEISVILLHVHVLCIIVRLVLSTCVFATRASASKSQSAFASVVLSIVNCQPVIEHMYS